MIGGVGEKIQTIVELAEELYERVNELRARVESMGETVEDTADRVERLETELAEQRALLEAIADDHGLDVDVVVASVEPDEPVEGDASEGAGPVDSAEDGSGESGEAAGASGPD